MDTDGGRFARPAQILRYSSTARLKNYDLIRFYDGRAIQMVPNEGKSVRYHCLRTVQVEVTETALPVGG
jgi:hypothetical protein